MKHKKISIFVIFLIILLCLSLFYSVFAEDSKAKELFTGGKMSAVQLGVEGGIGTDGGIGGVINIIIGILQLTGTGISVIMITMLGIKYLLASVEEKAEIKKSAMPILIGSILLFGAVNLIAIIEDFSVTNINPDS